MDRNLSGVPGQVVGNFPVFPVGSLALICSCPSIREEERERKWSFVEFLLCVVGRGFSLDSQLNP